MTEGKYGMLTIGEFSHQKGRDFYHTCKCDCGNERIMNVRHILAGGSKTCGCSRVRPSQEDKFNIALEYEAGAEIIDVATKYNASISVVQRAIKEFGVEFRSGLTEEQREEVKIKYELGMETRDLKKEYGVSSFYIRQCILSLGGKMRPAGTPLVLKEHEVQFAKEMYEAGEPSTDISATIGAGISVVCQALKRNGVKIRHALDRHKKYGLNENAFAEPTRDALYWAGFIGSDGCIYNNQLSISIHTQDYEHLIKFREFIGCRQEPYKERDKEAYTIKFSSHKICADLLKYGITPRKSLTYSPPDFCCESADFWRGMVDGDGCVRVGLDGKPTLSLVGAFDVIEGFKGWVRRFSKTKAHGSKHVNIYQFSIYGRNAIPCLNEMYRDNPKYFLDRKREAIKKFLDVYENV